MPASNKRVMVTELRRIIRDSAEPTEAKLKAIALLDEIDGKLVRRKAKKVVPVAVVDPKVGALLEKMN